MTCDPNGLSLSLPFRIGQKIQEGKRRAANFILLQVMQRSCVLCAMACTVQPCLLVWMVIQTLKLHSRPLARLAIHKTAALKSLSLR